MEHVLTLVQRRATRSGIEVALLMENGTALLDYLNELEMGEIDPGVITALQTGMETIQESQTVIGTAVADLTDRVEALETMLADYESIKAGLSEFADALAP